MTKLKNISVIDVIESIVASMRYGSTVASVTTISTGVYSFTTGNTYDLATGDVISINSVRYRVTNIAGKVITVTGTTTPGAATWTAEAPYFYHGTPIEANKDRANDIDGNMMKYPFICLFEPIESNFKPDDDNAVMEEPSLNMVFMTTADNEQWTTGQHFSGAINECKDLLLRFIEACNKSVYLDSNIINEFNIIYHAKWGLYVRTRGKEQFLFMENLSGVECNNIVLPIKKQYC